MRIAALLIFLFLFTGVSAQTREFSFCGKNNAEVSMSWDEFLSCKKELIPRDKGVTINSFVLTIAMPQKKDTVWTEYICKGNVVSKTALAAIDKLHKNGKMGNTVKIDAVEVLQSGREGRKAAGMTITLK
jgi:hypothetical protein